MDYIEGDANIRTRVFPLALLFIVSIAICTVLSARQDTSTTEIGTIILSSGSSSNSITYQTDWMNAHHGDTLIDTNTLSIASSNDFDIYVKSSNSYPDGKMATSDTPLKQLNNKLQIAIQDNSGHSGSVPSNPGLSSTAYQILNNQPQTYSSGDPVARDYTATYTQVIANNDPFCSGISPDIYEITIIWGFTASI